jgi:nicotinamidase-related amidase
MTTALLIIDVQNDLCSGQYAAFEAKRVIDRINQVISAARQAKAPVIVIQHEEPGGPMTYASDAWKLDPDLHAKPDDSYVRKTTPDSFHSTDLLAVLQAKNISKLVICGLQSEFCVDTTTRRALTLGYPVTLVADGHTTLDNKVLTAAQISAHHNEVLSSMGSFAGQARVVPAADVRFDA